MALSVAVICNMALGRIGHKKTITSLEDGTVEANACATYYEQLRDLVLEKLDWPFARRRVTLAELAGEVNDDWGYAYALPSDCVAPRRIWNSSRQVSSEGETPFRVESNAALTGRILLTDTEGAVLQYTAKVITPVMFSAHFVDALAWGLAAELVLSVATKPTLYPSAVAQFEMALRRAAAVAVNEERPDVPLLSEFERVRG